MSETPKNLINTDENPLDEHRVRQLVSLLNIHDTKAVLNFGTDAQRQLTAVADTMLADIQAKDTGEAGLLLSKMVMTLKGFQGSELTLKKKYHFWDKLLGKARPIEAFRQQFETVSDQIDQISNGLEKHKQTLLIDITSLDRLYDATLGYFRDLRHYIAAAEEIIRHADEHTLPVLKQHAEQTQNLEDAQKLRDHQSQRDELDRRLHDLRLTRQVAMQALPSIRLIQENNKGLVNKINSTLINTVPLWRQQLAQSLAIYRSSEAAQAIKASSDLTNDLLKNNAETLQTANRESRQQIERGVFDIEAVEQANQMLISTIEESIEIHEVARNHRKEAEKRLQDAENQLKQTLQHVATQQSQ
ncbi:toxic anion resistance protein [Suttonella ornithocola]|uniref:TelA-like protein SA1238 n=1 Tax=Suttonella ornithocola TaxID=279832 RepID=A0A380MNR2_9GAMM|nr:toxic anion resistance protein [Suttonella ornithocola]SUO93814.1 TelA-like protein SA1238 [Suttonella ornithocola]